MWLMTRYGFFSVTEAPGDPTWHQWRARRRDHLERLREAFVIPTGIVTTLSSDYRYRMFLAPVVTRALVSSLACDIDYIDFKSTVAKEWGKDDPYTEALTAVWRTMGELQPGGPYNWDTWQYHDSDDWDDEPMDQER